MEERIATTNNNIWSVKLVIGLFFAALGVLLTLDNLNLVDAHLYLRFWPVIFIAIGLLRIADPTSRMTGVIALVAGAALLTLTTHTLRLFDLWPVLLIGAGVVIVAQAFGFKPEGLSASGAAILSHRKLTIDSRDFKGIQLTSILGGTEIDLTGADIAHPPAVIEVFVFMGGIEMKIPEGWEVIGEAVPFMGGIEVKTRSQQTGRKLILRGFVMMGGVEIKDVPVRTV